MDELCQRQKPQLHSSYIQRGLSNKTQKLGRHFHRIVAPLHSTIQDPSWSLQDLSQSKEHLQASQQVLEN